MPSHRRHLTRRQAHVLMAISEFMAQNGYAPSMRELASQLGLTPGTVHFHIHSLIARGYLLHDGTDHGITLIDGKDLQEGARFRLPLLGTIAAGLPLEVPEEIPRDVLESVEVPESLASRATYALRVRGDSMKDDGINDGDYVLVHKQDTVENGQIAVALLPDGAATLKRVFKERGRYRLQPANLSLTPIYVPRLRIQGRVLGLIRIY